jgi:hypothetical protein
MSNNEAMFLTDNNVYFVARTVQVWQEQFCGRLISLKYVICFEIKNN